MKRALTPARALALFVVLLVALAWPLSVADAQPALQPASQPVGPLAAQSVRMKVLFAGTE